jgi:hypothetical protein
MTDNINKPAHYTSGTIQPIDVIEDWNLGFKLGNCIKYVARAGKKDGATYCEDLKKARWYLDREISQYSDKLDFKAQTTPHVPPR